MRRLATYMLALTGVFAAAAEFRFPMPEFESGYQYPPVSAPLPSPIPVLIDIGVLAAALALTAWAVLRLRSRRLVFAIALLSLAWFGFYRQGCVCPVGSLQNVFEAAMGRATGLPVVVAVFFLLPLIFALYFGRVFCAAVCPLGAAQEMCAIHPVQVPRSVENALGLLPYAYLGLAAVSVATGSGYLVCRFDPFVGFFRPGSSFGMLITGGAILILGIFVARPYCRYLCPYGVLLRWASRFSKWHASITPAECIQCRLCETACPYGAIVTPTPATAPSPRREGARRLERLLIATPLIVGVGALAGYGLHETLARLHPTVRLAERLAAEEQGLVPETTLETDAFRAGQQQAPELYAAANAIVQRYRPYSAGFGAFFGLVLCGRLVRLSLVRKRKDYEADRAACLSCARCFAYCPVEKNHDNS